ncbi:ulp-1 [Nucleospora cyclopteri]
MVVDPRLTNNIHKKQQQKSAKDLNSNAIKISNILHDKNLLCEKDEMVFEVSSDRDSDSFCNLENLKESIKMQKSLKEIFSKTNEIKKIKVFDTIIYKSDLRRLLPNKWLNDKILNVYLENIGRKCVSNKYFSTYFFTSLIKYRNNENINSNNTIKEYVKNIKINLNYNEAAKDWIKYKKLFFPIHSSTHWTLFVYDFNNLMVFDSLESGFKNSRNAIIMSLILKKIFNKPVPVKIMTNIPKQNNGDDCGVFVCMFSKCLSFDLKFYRNPDMNNYRAYLLYEILFQDIILSSNSLKTKECKIEKI